MLDEKIDEQIGKMSCVESEMKSNVAKEGHSR